MALDRWFHRDGKVGAILISDESQWRAGGRACYTVWTADMTNDEASWSTGAAQDGTSRSGGEESARAVGRA